MFVLSCLAYFTEHDVLGVLCVVVCYRIPSIKGRILVHTSPIRASVRGPLGCCHVAASVIGAAADVAVCFQLSARLPHLVGGDFRSCIHHRVGIWDAKQTR